MTEIIRAATIAGIPLLMISFTLVLWSIKKNYIGVDDDLDLLQEKKEESKDKKSDFKMNLIHQKWLFFGGGYYGTMAFATYVVIETREIFDFFAAYTTFANLIDQISISALFGLIVESFLNIIPAFIWFNYWPDIFTIENGWYWLLASYVGYYIGSYGAKFYAKTRMIQQE